MSQQKENLAKSKTGLTGIVMETDPSKADCDNNNDGNDSTNDSQSSNKKYDSKPCKRMKVDTETLPDDQAAIQAARKEIASQPAVAEASQVNDSTEILPDALEISKKLSKDDAGIPKEAKLTKQNSVIVLDSSDEETENETMSESTVENLLETNNEPSAAAITAEDLSTKNGKKNIEKEVSELKKDCEKLSIDMYSSYIKIGENLTELVANFKSSEASAAVFQRKVVKLNEANKMLLELLRATNDILGAK